MAYVIWTNRDKTEIPAHVVRESKRYITLQYRPRLGHPVAIVRFRKNADGEGGSELGESYMGYKYYRRIEEG